MDLVQNTEMCAVLQKPRAGGPEHPDGSHPLSQAICCARWRRGNQHSHLEFLCFSISCAGDSVSRPSRPDRRTILPARGGGWQPQLPIFFQFGTFVLSSLVLVSSFLFDICGSTEMAPNTAVAPSATAACHQSTLFGRYGTTLLTMLFSPYLYGSHAPMFPEGVGTLVEARSMSKSLTLSERCYVLCVLLRLWTRKDSSNFVLCGIRDTRISSAKRRA